MSKKKPLLCYSVDGEHFHNDIESALGDPGAYAPGAEIEVADRVPINIEELIWIDTILEGIQEQANEEVGEAAEDWLQNVSQSAKNRLLALVKRWIKQHDAPRFYKVENARPYTLTAEDLE